MRKEEKRRVKNLIDEKREEEKYHVRKWREDNIR